MLGWLLDSYWKRHAKDLFGYCRELVKQLADAQKLAQNWESQATARSVNMANLERELAETKVDLANSFAANDAIAERLRHLESSLTKRNDAVNLFAKTNEELKESLNASYKANQLLTKDLSASRAANEQLLEELTTLKTGLPAITKANEDLKTERDELRQRVKDLCNEWDDARWKFAAKIVSVAEVFNAHKQAIGGDDA